MSATAMKQVKQAHNALTQDDMEFPIGVIVVQDARPVSNEVADRLEVKHESPQCLLFKQ